MEEQMKPGFGYGEKLLRWGLLLLLLAFCALFLNSRCWPDSPATNVQQRPIGVITDTPTIIIAGTTATSTATPTTSAREAQIQWSFGTVTGSYGACTVQALTSYDGRNFFTVGSAASITVATGEFNAWTIIEQLGTTSVTTSSVSASTTPSSVTALGFGQLTEYTFACSGGYGSNAAVTVTVIYR
jgi:hypothetical protein